PAIATGRSELKGNLAGTFDVDATVSNVSEGVTADNVTGTMRATLDRSTIGDLTFDWANVDADYDRRAGTIRDLEVVGRDLNVEASGTLALNDTGSSDLTFRADSRSLEEIGNLIGKPLAGTATIDGTVTGNRPLLQASGTAVADAARYGENGALTLKTAYTVEVPELAFDRANAKAQTDATFVTLAGQNINELAAKATYADKELTFDATAKQPERSLGVAGSVRLQPDHQELHVQRLALSAQGQSWELERGSSPVVQYGPDAITIDGFTLTSADQR